MADSGESPNDDAYVSLSTMILSGSAVFAGAAAIVGTAHWHSTAKQLKEEGIPLSARQQALPLAAKALFASTFGCIVVGGIAAAAFSMLGGEYKGSTSVGSFSNAMDLIQEQRDLIRDQFQRLFSGDTSRQSRDDKVNDVAKK